MNLRDSQQKLLTGKTIALLARRLCASKRRRNREGQPSESGSAVLKELRTNSLHLILRPLGVPWE